MRTAESGWKAYFSLTILLMVAVPMRAEATLIFQGTEQEKKELQQIIDEFKKDSLKAQAEVADLEKTVTGNVTVKFGNTIDLATASRPPDKIITINKAAIAAMKLIDKPGGGGKALEQFSTPYLFGHEGVHILNPTLTEDQVVSKINEVQVEKGSVKRTKYNVDIVDRKTVLSFDDGSKVDLTDAFRIAAGGGATPGVAIFQQANFLGLSAVQQASGAIALTLDTGIGDQYMTLYLPNELGGGSISVKLLELSAILNHSVSSDFSLVASDFYMKFDAFNLGGANTGTNIIRPYLDHQTPFGYWKWISDNSFTFDLSGDLGWTNALFGPDDMALAVESISGAMLPTGSDHWSGTGNLTGAKFAVPEPSSTALLLLGFVTLVGIRYARVRRIGALANEQG